MWRTWLFIAYSDESTSNPHCISLKRLGLISSFSVAQAKRQNWPLLIVRWKNTCFFWCEIWTASSMHDLKQWVIANVSNSGDAWSCPDLWVLEQAKPVFPRVGRTAELKSNSVTCWARDRNSVFGKPSNPAVIFSPAPHRFKNGCVRS